MDCNFRVLTPHSDVAEIFKTPGKLRGKTPKTVRKENHENRAVRNSQPLQLCSETEGADSICAAFDGYLRIQLTTLS